MSQRKGGRRRTIAYWKRCNGIECYEIHKNHRYKTRNYRNTKNNDTDANSDVICLCVCVCGVTCLDENAKKMRNENCIGRGKRGKEKVSEYLWTCALKSVPSQFCYQSIVWRRITCFSSSSSSSLLLFCYGYVLEICCCCF